MNHARLLSVLTLTCACADRPAPTATSGTASASAPAPAASAPTPLATSSQASAPASAAAPKFEPTPEPELMEWAKSKIVKVPGSGKNECETRMVREWLRVMCVNRSAERGTPQSITVTRGRAPKERYKGENLKVVNDTTTLLVPVRPGTDFAASFEWTNGSDELTVAWPEGEPESARVMAFKSGTEAAAAADAAPTSSAAAPPAPAEPAALKTEPALEDVASLAATPNDEAWAAAPEARVKGSTAAGCETKTSGDWFRARCKAASVEQAFTEVVPLRGHRKTQTKAEVSGDTATLVTPYVEGTELHVRFVGKSGGQTLVLRWSKGPRPETIGAFEKGK